MKRIIFLTVLASLCLACPQPSKADPITIVITTVVKKVIRAMDLAIQRLQNETIKLQNVQKALENVMSKLKLEEISEWGEKQRSLFAGFYEELWKVKSAISTYKRVKDIVEQQLQLVKEYKRAFNLFNQDKHFSVEELAYIANVYNGILEESLRNIDQITMVVSAFSTQMADAKRLEIIHRTAQAVSSNLTHLRQFTRQNALLSISRAKEKHELLFLRQMYGITSEEAK